MRAYDSGCCFRGASAADRPRVIWELTTKCNLSCSFCHARPFAQAGVSTSEVIDGLHLLKQWGVSGVIFSGGEPLLRKDCLEILETASTLGLEVDLCTNGTLVNDDVTSRLKACLTEVSVSFDSANPEIHNRLRGRPKAWSKAVAGIQKLANQGLEVHAITLVCDDTYPSIEDSIRFLRDLGVHSVTLLGLVPIEVPTVPYRLSADIRAMLEKDLPRIRQIIKGIIINTKRVIRFESPEFCGAGKSIWGIDAQGHLLPCILLKGKVNSRSIQDYQKATDWTQIADNFSRHASEPYWTQCSLENEHAA